MATPSKLMTPEGFQVEFQEEGRLVLRGHREDGSHLGFVSIDFDWRRWQLGYNGAGLISHDGPAGCSSRGKSYSGRGWREALIHDATAALVAAGDF